MQSKPRVRRPVSITINGRLYRGTYAVVGSTITVSALGQSETTQTGHMPVEDLAKVIRNLPVGRTCASMQDYLRRR